VSRLALFGYASLVSPQSASRTLGRAVEPVAIARLPGWRRRWSQARDNLTCEKTFARSADGSLFRHVLGLNLEPTGEADEAPNGVLLELTEEELRRLDVREMRYDRVDVTEQVEASGGMERVFAYTAKEAHFAPDPPEDTVVLASYARTVESAFAALGAGQRDVYMGTTGPPPVEVVEAVLVRDRIPPGNPRDW
jgi:cation transport regulator ChaC